LKTSTKHAISQRLLALLGFVLAIGPYWGLPYVGASPAWTSLLGFLLAFIGVLSGAGFGPWGKHFTKLYVNDHRAEIGRPPIP
jgi:hypothetical protein